MTEDIIRDVWCLVATPFKADNPVVRVGKKTRRVAGEKGLGRLSVARLGDRLQILTQAPGETCWEVTVDWSSMAEGDDMAACYAQFREYPEESPFKESGTRLTVLGLKGQWDENAITDLEENLARLISPFADLGEFNIFLTPPGDSEAEEIHIESPEFLNRPKYVIAGEVDEDGSIECTYRYRPITSRKVRKKKLGLTWEQVYDQILDPKRVHFSAEGPGCGAFSFEIRAWDIGSGDTDEIAEKFDFQKSQVRKAIRAHKGISVYRDGVLVLPKSDTARDWLGLDLRRISKVGTRMSTSQVVGYVSITAEDNPDIEDTSDRERLVACLALAEFEELLKAVVGLLENERDEDRAVSDREKPMEEIFEDLSAEDLVSEVIALAEDNAKATEAVPLLEAFNEKLDKARDTIQQRFVFYSRMATVGTIAQMLVHEIRNRTTAYGAFLDFVTSRFGPFKDKALKQEYRCADDAVTALERLADTFAPLASRSFRRRLRKSMLEERIRECIGMQRGEAKRKGVEFSIPDSRTFVAVDPGELDAILLNLISNAIYWLGQVKKGKRRIVFRLSPVGQGKRIRVWVHDTGPGVDEEDVDKVFWPGVTRKPGGIGMGLTVASELVAEYGGRMSVKHPGTRGGASFGFDLPLRK
ncbi:sensor histidine kinase, partial [Verrucomicrobiota bacterium]